MQTAYEFKAVTTGIVPKHLQSRQLINTYSQKGFSNLFMCVMTDSPWETSSQMSYPAAH